MIIVHGGAWNIPNSLIDLHKAAVAESASIGMKMLTNGGSSIDAVESAVRSMEDKVFFNAGKGAARNSEGELELDAMIMDGATLKAGGVAAVKNIFHPITLARRVMELTDHVLIVGDGARKFARKCGIVEQRIEDLLSRDEAKLYDELNSKPATVKKLFAGDTVGAVAIDVDGNITAGTSTGGLSGKLPGRVGDTPLPGCGAYADNQSGGVSATGWGEAITRVVLSKHACDLMVKGVSSQEACEAAVGMLAQKVKGWGGLIGIDAKGGLGVAYNTGRMARAFLTEEMNTPKPSV
ncbi:MAG: isoaspartyl peptidase/L-asparaginase [Thaumarchaeota archaeon]|nr:isoaspartyl peptidase/L-asparaginase [Nitrososphaerota archaeon]